MTLESFAALAARPEPRLDELALALAAEFGEVDVASAFHRLDTLGEEIAAALDAGGDPDREVEAVREVLGRRHGFVGDRDDYDHPDNSMLDRVLSRRTGLPILLSVVYVEASRRAGVELAGVGLPGHYVVGHFGRVPPLVLDPFSGGRLVEVTGAVELAAWSAQRTAGRMLNNLVGTYRRRHDLARAIRAAELRIGLPLDEADATAFKIELTAMRATLN